MSGSNSQLKSTMITNRDANPKVLSDVYLGGGGLKAAEGFVTTGAQDNTASRYIMLSIPSNARVESVKLQTQALGTSASLDVGVNYPETIPLGSGLSASSAGAVINTTCFASAQACSNALAATELVGANVAINAQEKQLWDLAGLTSDPGLNLDIVIQVHAATSLAGYVGLKATYTP